MTALPKNYEAMTPEQRKLYDETVAKNKSFNEVMAAMRARNKLQQEKLQADHAKAVEEYKKGQKAHIDNIMQASNKLGNVNIGERKCPQCGKTIFVQDKTAWLFKIRYGKGFVYLCSESCKEKRAGTKVKRSKRKK